MAFIDAHRHLYPVAVMCRVLEFAERTYYAAKVRPPSARAVAAEEEKVKITAEWTSN